MKGRTAVVLLAVTEMVIGACGRVAVVPDEEKSNTQVTEKPPVPTGSTIDVVGKEFSFDPANLTLKAGEGSTVVLKNTGSIEHDLTVDEAGFKLSVAGNNTREKVLKVDKPGTYRFYCSLPGHRDAGMKGELTVR